MDNKSLFGLLDVSMVLALLLGAIYYTKEPVYHREILPLPIKFGTNTKPDARYEPIIRLATTWGRGFCSGWIIDANYAITAGHCINHDGRLSKDKVKLYDMTGSDTNTIATPVGLDERMDLGLLMGDFSNFRTLPTEFNEEGFPMDTPHTYTSCGYPLGQKKLSCTRVVPFKTNYFMVEAYGHLIAGTSGGPVIDDVTGKATALKDAVGEDSAFLQPIQGYLALFGLE